MSADDAPKAPEPTEAPKAAPVQAAVDDHPAPASMFGKLEPPRTVARPSAVRRTPDDAADDGPSQDDPPSGDNAVPTVVMWLLTLFFAGVVIASVDSLMSIWPPDANAPASASARILWGLVPLSISTNDRLMLITIFMGVIGAMIHSLTSFADFVGNRRLARSWLPWYMLRPVIGSGLALFFYLVFRGGLLTGNATQDINPFGIAAIGGLAGMFSKQATDKLSEVFSTMFKTSTESGDHRRGEKLGENAPTGPTAATVPTAAQDS